MCEQVPSKPARPGPVDEPGRRCPACENHVKPETRFCTQCGARLAVPADNTKERRDKPAHPILPEKPSDNTQLEPTLVRSAPPFRAATCSCGQELIAAAAYCHSCGLRAGAPSSRFVLVGISPDIRGRTVPLTDQDLTIGKGAECDLPLVQDDYASHRHARIVQAERMVYLEDLGSSNGTYLRIRRSVALDVGDEIVVGRSVIRLEKVNGARIACEDATCPAPCE